MSGAGQRLVILDVDGTLVDSQNFILAAMAEAFETVGEPAPTKTAALGIVGLSLPEAMATLCPDIGTARQQDLATAYKRAFHGLRERSGGEAMAPLYPGARAAVERLSTTGFALSIATGKARRGLDHFLQSHELEGFFGPTQTADDAPSKPHPQMVLNCLAATGIAAGSAVMVGDTEFDMAMGRAAGCRTVGVAWGYHPRARLQRGGADLIIDDFSDLDAALDAVLEAV